MPTYDYTCKKCGNHEEVFQKMTDETLTKCEFCGTDSLQRGFGGGIGVSFVENTGDCRKDSNGCCPCTK